MRVGAASQAKPQQAGGRSESGRRQGATRIVGACCKVDGESWLQRLWARKDQGGGEEESYGFVESSVYMKVKRGTPPKAK